MQRFSTWGRGPGAGLSARVRTNEHRSALQGAVARIVRETGLSPCGGPRLGSTPHDDQRLPAANGQIGD